MTLATEEFMRRFLLHVLPCGFHRIRHYGLLANANRKHNIATVRELLHQPHPVVAADSLDVRNGSGTARPTFVCRHCGALCSSSRPSHAHSASAVRRARHERTSHNVNSPVGHRSSESDAYPYCPTSTNVPPCRP
jgi:hypothetical protein